MTDEQEAEGEQQEHGVLFVYWLPQEADAQRGNTRERLSDAVAIDVRAGRSSDEFDQGDDLHPAGKNPGDVFEVNVRPFPEAHFAVYPPELCEKPIKASCPPKVCAECGSSYERIVDRTPGEYDYSERGEKVGNGQQASGAMLERPQAETVGWESSCGCDADDTKPGIVLDPFAGAGTTCLVAKRLGRRFIGIDLNPEYVAMAQKRVGIDVDNPEHLREDGEMGLDAYADGGNDE